MKLRWFGLRLLAILARSALFVPAFEFLYALYQRPEGLARPRGVDVFTPEQLAASAAFVQARWAQYGVIWLFGLAAAALGLWLRAQNEERGTAGFSVWKALGVLAGLLLLGGAACWSFAGLGLSVPFLCAAAAVVTCGVWGWLGAVQEPVLVLSPSTCVVTICLHVVCLAVVAIMTFFNREPSPMNTGAMAASLVLSALISIYLLTVGKIDYDLDNSGAGMNRSAPEVRRYNVRAALVSILAVILIGAASFGGVYWAVDRTVGLIGDGAYAVLSGLMDNRASLRRVSEKTEDEPQTVPPALELRQEEPEPLGAAESAAVISGLFLLIALACKPFWSAIAGGIAGLFRRGGPRSRSNEELFYVETVEQLTPSDTKGLFERVPGRDPLRKALRRYASLRDPGQRVRAALPLLRRLASEQRLPVADGDTARQTVLRFGGSLEQGALEGYAQSYERVRYGGLTALPEDGERAASLVRAAEAIRAEASSAPKSSRRTRSAESGEACPSRTYADI